MSDERNQSNVNQHPPFRTNCEVAIHVPDLAVAERFYGGVLGFKLVSRTEDYLEFDTGVLRLYVNRDETARTYIPSIDVPNYPEARAALEAAGCRTVPVAGHAGQVYFQDPFGFIFDIIERP